ncbi:hypothetical protein FGG08_005025 [Glutinoglossum americanum]|uniref:Early meiotic induction protein 1 n=1 Tax=Glutinoglossum americanum TaxID=1670608 RepID=A0A9P8HZ93_9PEZI|nr:hypothetical protein FGG08_005025 [Glutinoglossum americanum]
MGWWSRAPSAEVDPKNTSDGTPNTPAASSAAVPTDNRPRALTRDEQADLELKDILRQLDAEQASAARGSRKHLTDGSDHHPSTTDISPDSLYPTTMSCRQAFDMAFYCQSLGGQFQNIYRYGGLRDCSENWSQFWFCMRTKSQPEPKKAAMIQEHYKQRAVKYKIGSSSEDIWEVRKEPLVGAFTEDPDGDDGNAIAERRT